MPKHTKVLVPLETWAFHSPRQYIRGITSDIGLLAESLIYYDHVFVIIQQPKEIDSIIEWFAKYNQLPVLLRLLHEKILQFYHYAFLSTAVEKNGVYTVYNIQDQGQADDINTFIPRVIYKSRYEDFFIHARQKARFLKLVEDNYVEVKAREFETAVQNARADYQDLDRDIIVTQALIDEIYDLIRVKKHFEVAISVSRQHDIRKVEWNLNFNEINKRVGVEILEPGKPLAALAQCNRLLWSSAMLDSDIFLENPMSHLAGDKLIETRARTGNIKNLIDQFIVEVEFPSIRNLVNSGELGPVEILAIRRKAVRFRGWLQDEAEKDRNSIIAYHQEVSKEAGLVRAGRSIISILGVPGGAIAGAAVGVSLDPTVGVIWGPAAGALAGESVKFIADMVSQFGIGWKPAVFGNWTKTRIERYLRARIA